MMNKIVRENYPVDRLPADLKSEVGSAQYVRVVIEDVGDHTPPTKDHLIALLEKARTLQPIGDDPVERIRQLRDEWDD